MYNKILIMNGDNSEIIATGEGIVAPEFSDTVTVLYADGKLTVGVVEKVIEQYSYNDGTNVLDPGYTVVLTDVSVTQGDPPSNPTPDEGDAFLMTAVDENNETIFSANTTDKPSMQQTIGYIKGDSITMGTVGALGVHYTMVPGSDNFHSEIVITLIDTTVRPYNPNDTLSMI